MSRKRAFYGCVYNQKRKKIDISSLTSSDNNLTKAKNGLEHIRSLFCSRNFKQNLPPIIMKHQIYALFPDRTEVDKELNQMKQSGKIRFFKLGGSPEELATVFLDDYKEYINKKNKNNPIVAHFIQNVVEKCSDISYSKEVLVNEYFLKEENISELIQHGVLTSRDVGHYWLSIPQAGEFIKSLLFGRRFVLQQIRRTKYKEILQSELEQRKLLKKSPLCILYHIYDIIGADLVKCIEVSTGRLLRLQCDS